MQQSATDFTAMPDAAQAPPAGSSITGPQRAERLPVGRRGQLHALKKQLVWCDHAVRVAQRQAAAAMRDADLSAEERWAAVRELRALSWKVCREVLPLTGRVPQALQAEPEFIECQRVMHALRRRTEEALRDNANYTADLVTPDTAKMTFF